MPADGCEKVGAALVGPLSCRGYLAADTGAAGRAGAQVSSMQGQQLAAFVRSAGTTVMKLLLQHAHRQRAVFSTGPSRSLAGQAPGLKHSRLHHAGHGPACMGPTCEAQVLSCMVVLTYSLTFLLCWTTEHYTCLPVCLQASVQGQSTCAGWAWTRHTRQPAWRTTPQELGCCWLHMQRIGWQRY